MILNYCIEGVDIGEDDMAEIGEEVRRRGRPPPLAVSVWRTSQREGKI